MTKRFRSIVTKTAANKDKKRLVAALLPAWREGLSFVRDMQVDRIRRGERISWLSTTDFPNYLRARQWKSVTNQVNNDLLSWQAKIKTKVKPLIFGLDIDDDDRHELFKKNLRGEWFKDNRLAKMVEGLIETDVPLPSYKHTTIMLMDNLIAPIQEARKNTAYKEWVRVTLPDRDPVYLPLEDNPYLDSQPGSSKMIQVKVLGEDSIELRVVKVDNYEPKTPDTTKEIGLDWGLKNLISTSDGRLYGSHLYTWLLDRDKELTELAKKLQASGIKKLNSSKRYRRLNRRIRDHVINEVGRIINLLGKEELAHISVESLDFRGGGLSRRLNRIISRAGRKVLRQRLSELSEDTGVQVTEVPAFYSSRECFSCGYVSKKNRKSQPVFQCKFCGNKSHADVNAAKVVRDRRSIPSFGGSISKEDALEVLDQRFTQRWGLTFDQFQERSTPRPRSRASSRVKAAA